MVQAAAREEILANGGSISHHHGGEKYFLVVLGCVSCTDCAVYSTHVDFGRGEFPSLSIPSHLPFVPLRSRHPPIPSLPL